LGDRKIRRRLERGKAREGSLQRRCRRLKQREKREIIDVAADSKGSAEKETSRECGQIQGRVTLESGEKKPPDSERTEST